jgi:hypothetical protein
MNTCSHNHLAAAAMCFTALLTGCASLPPAAEPPTLLAAQRLVLDVATGEHQLLDADSRRAQELATNHPGRLVRVTAPTPGVVSLGNVSIPLALGASRAPAVLPSAPSLPEESSP